MPDCVSVKAIESHAIKRLLPWYLIILLEVIRGVKFIAGKGSQSSWVKILGELPRNEQQVSNFKRKKTSIENTVANGDALYTVMFRAQMEDSGNKFARNIKAYPNHAILVASDRQLNDVARFRCDPYVLFR